MAQAKPRKTVTRKKRARRAPSRASRRFERLPIGRILLFLGLAMFLFISIAAAGYVIFFRVVVADGCGCQPSSIAAVRLQPMPGGSGGKADDGVT